MGLLRKTVTVAVSAFVVAGGVCDAAAQEADTAGASQLGTLAWLTGCWLAADGTEERWTDGRGGQMLGVNRSFRDGRVVRWEFLRIYQGRTAPIYAAAPSHQPPTEFDAAVASADSVVFLNPEHDFPTGLGYRRIGSDSLLVSVFGPGEGGARGSGFEIRFGRRSCDDPSG